MLEEGESQGKRLLRENPRERELVPSLWGCPLTPKVLRLSKAYNNNTKEQKEKENKNPHYVTHKKPNLIEIKKTKIKSPAVQRLNYQAPVASRR